MCVLECACAYLSCPSCVCLSVRVVSACLSICRARVGTRFMHALQGQFPHSLPLCKLVCTRTEVVRYCTPFQIIIAPVMGISSTDSNASEVWRAVGRNHEGQRYPLGGGEDKYKAGIGNACTTLNTLVWNLEAFKLSLRSYPLLSTSITFLAGANFCQQLIAAVRKHDVS